MGNNGQKNKQYLDSVSADKKDQILRKIANHYGISLAEVEQEVKDADAEMLYEYITNNALRIDVYNDFNTNKMADGGMIESKINELYKKSKFINDDFNWKLKLMEMIQDRSIEAYNIYQSLTKQQKEQVLQEQYEVDNDMGSDGDGKIKTTKENIRILLSDAKNGEKYAKGSTVKGGGVGDTIADRYARLTEKEAKRLDELSKKVRINEQTDAEDIEWDKLVHKYRGWDYKGYGKYAKGSTVKGGGVSKNYAVIHFADKKWIKKRYDSSYKAFSDYEYMGSIYAELFNEKGNLLSVFPIPKYNKHAKGTTVKGNYVPKNYKGQLYDVFAIKNGKWEKLNDEVGGLTKKHAENIVNAINKGDGQNFTKGYSNGFMDKEGVRSFQKYALGGLTIGITHTYTIG